MKIFFGRPFFVNVAFQTGKFIVQNEKKKTCTQMKNCISFASIFFCKLILLNKKVLTTYLVFYFKFKITIETYKLKKNKRKHFFLHLKKKSH